MLGTDRALARLALRIAFVWTPALGRERALEAANNTVAPLAFPDDVPPIVILAAGVLDHRVRRFGWEIDERAVDFLAMQAARVWIATGREAACVHLAAREVAAQVPS